MTLDRSETNFKGGRSLQINMYDFLIRNLRSDTLAKHFTVKYCFCTNLGFKHPAKVFDLKFLIKKIVQIDLKDFLDP